MLLRRIFGFAFLLGALFVANPLHAQSNVAIALGSGYSGAGATFTLLNPNGYNGLIQPSPSYTILLSSSGAATLTTLGTGIQYGVIVCKTDGSACLKATVNVSGQAQDITTTLQANPLGPGSSMGTVTSVSCVSGCTVANPTTTPAITVTATGSVTSVTGTAPITSSGGTTPAIGCATCETNGGTPITVGAIPLAGTSPALANSALSDNGTTVSSSEPVAVTGAVSATTGFSSVTKDVTAPMGGPGSGSTGTLTVGTELCIRQINVLPVTPTSFIIHIRNYNALTSSAKTGALNGTGIWIGAPAYPGTGTNRWQGNFTTTPTNIVSTFALNAAGDEYSSASIPNAGYITARIPFAISIGVNNIAGGGSVTVVKDAEGGWNYVGSGASTSAGATGAPNSLSANSSTYLDVRIEYQYPTSLDATGNYTIPVGMVIGDSITQGLSNSASFCPASGSCLWQYESWPGSAGLAKNFAPVNMGISSSKTSDWTTNTTWAWGRAYVCTHHPDFAGISLGINDLVNAVSAATIEANLLSVIAQVQSCGVNRIYLGTMIPGGWPQTTVVATTTTSSKVVTVASTFGLTPNMAFTCTSGLPASETIVAIDSALQIELSANVTTGNIAITCTAGPTPYTTTTAQEQVRQAVNQWIRSVPSGVTGVWDFDNALATLNLPGNAPASLVSAYPHPDPAGYQAMSNVVKF